MAPAASDPTRLASWIEVRPDNTIAFRTGVSDFGQGAVGTVFRQIVAEELRVPFEAVTGLATVHEHRARPTVTCSATELRPRQPELVPEHVQQRARGRRHDIVLAPIHDDHRSVSLACSLRIPFSHRS